LSTHERAWRDYSTLESRATELALFGAENARADITMHLSKKWPALSPGFRAHHLRLRHSAGEPGRMSPKPSGKLAYIY
jgi:hypothetical protein